MIASIKSEWRKNSRRPAFLIAAAGVAVVAIIAYSVNYYEALHPAAGRDGRAAVSLLSLYPDEMVNFLVGAAFPLGAALAIVLGAITAGSDFGWGTLKTALTQRPGRLAVLAGRVVTFQAWMAVLTLILFAVGGASSVVIAMAEGHSVAWPPAIDLLKGLGAVWLVLACYGSLGIALGTLFRQPAAAVGIGLIYIVIVQQLLVRFLSTIGKDTYRGLIDALDGQNSSSLLQSFTSPVAAHAPAPPIGSTQAVMVLALYVVAFVGATMAMMARRDVG
jgi:ABC-type transport system involved in multi-copper enzyme maturation permease subunit